MEGETKEFLINEDMKAIREEDEDEVCDTGSEYNEEEEDYEEEEEHEEEEEGEDYTQHEKTINDESNFLNQELQTCRCSDVIIQGLTIVFIMQILNLGFMIFT